MLLRYINRFPLGVGVLGLSIAISCGREADMNLKLADIVPREISGWTMAEAVEEYDRETIFDYIDGAGEVYRAYDFRKVSVFRFNRPNSPDISLEIFDMGRSDDAYGVFSHAREEEKTGIGKSYEYRGTLLHFWQNRYYICVLAEDKSDPAEKAVFALARHISERLPQSGERPKLVNLLPPGNLDLASVHYFHNQAMLNYHYFLSEGNLLRLDAKTDVVLGRHQPTGALVVCVRYPTADDARTAHQSFISGYLPDARDNAATQLENGRWAAARMIDQFIIIVLEAPSQNEAASLLEAAAARIDKMTGE